MKKRNIGLLVLMGCSIILLLVLQFYWIRSEYKSAEDTFRRETNLVFRNTVASLLDSLYMSRIDVLGADTTMLQYKHKRFRRADNPDSMAFAAIGRALKLDFSRSKLIVSRDSTDSLPPAVRGTTQPVKSIMIRINPDSLDVQSLENQYNTNLQELDRKIMFKVLEKEPGERFHTDTTFMTDFIRIGPPTTRQYAASFEGVPLLLLKEVYPQIIFSVLLTIMIGLAYFVTYKNLITQQKLSMQKDEFINNVSHELKTPIATVNVALEAFKNFNALDNPKMTHEYLDIVKTELDRLSLLTERILNTSVYEHLGIEVDNEVFDFSYVVNQIVKSINLSTNKGRVAVDTGFHGTDFSLRGSKLHLTNLLHNLLDNAIKHGRFPVLVTLTEESRQLVLQVKDHGIGIPREYKRKIFDKFFRVPHGDVHNVKGYGLGLSYVMQVVKAHKGTIEVDSEPDKGTIFTVKLPKNG